MAGPSVTNIFANSTVADATQVNKNFQDLIDGMTDGTKDLTINAFSTAGTTTLGNSSSDDLVVTASLASNIVPKTDAAYDLGSSALGMRAVYLGDASGDTAKLVAPTLAADVVLTTPASTSTLLGHNAQQVPYALGYLPGALLTASGVAATLLATELVDTHNAYDGTTGLFVCPEDGVYEFGAVVQCTLTTAFDGTSEVFSIRALNTTTGDTFSMGSYIPPSCAGSVIYTGAFHIDCTTADILKIQVFQNSGSNMNVPGSAALQTRIWFRKIVGTA